MSFFIVGIFAVKAFALPVLVVGGLADTISG